MNKKVVVTISGGVVQGVFASTGVEVEIVDFDNLEEEGADLDEAESKVVDKVKKFKLKSVSGY